jgi:DNA-binding XRE family transcriptional regulator
MTNKTKSTRVQPKLEDLLPTPELRVAFEEASAALEAGQLVRAMRNKAGLTQVQLAERLKVEQPRISAIEAGRGRDGPSYALLKRIAIACNIPWWLPDIVLPEKIAAA